MEIIIRNLDAQSVLDRYDYYKNISVKIVGLERIKGVWRHMINRCYGKSNDYKSYKRNKIQVCQYWLYSFDNFYYWAMNNGYSDNLTIDRINNDLDYTPNNCRWVTEEKNRKYKGYISRPEIGY